MSTVVHGTPSHYQLNNRILVCCLAAYGGREVPQGFEWLKESCLKYEIQLTVFGWGERFVDMYESKLAYIGKCIYDLRNDYDFVICVDSADCLFINRLEEYKLYPSMVFMAERNAFPLEQLRHPISQIWTNKHSTYKFLNAGGFSGKMVNVVKTFGYMAYRRHWQGEVADLVWEGMSTITDDQAAWNYEFLKGYVTIDQNCEMFQTLWGVAYGRDLEIVDGRLVNLEHFNKPLVLHANGGNDYEFYYKNLVSKEEITE